MNNWINVLIVDDDRRYVTIQAENAAHHGINLIHCPYWDEAHKLIDGDPHKYDVIVLDGKGQINAASESEDINHLKKALKELYILEGKGIAIPYVVNTGYSESSAIGYDVKVFHKGTGEQQLFELHPDPRQGQPRLPDADQISPNRPGDGRRLARRSIDGTVPPHLRLH